jgi:hypothetical protein
MARTTVSPVDIKRTGSTPNPVAPDVANGNQFPNDGNTVLRVANTGGGACTVTVPVAVTVDGLAVTNLSVVVPATNGVREIGPFPVGTYLQPDGNTYFNCSTATGVTVEVNRLPR